jgi:hypothetical protein
MEHPPGQPLVTLTAAQCLLRGAPVLSCAHVLPPQPSPGAQLSVVLQCVWL